MPSPRTIARHRALTQAGLPIPTHGGRKTTRTGPLAELVEKAGGITAIARALGTSRPTIQRRLDWGGVLAGEAESWAAVLGSAPPIRAS